MQRRIKPDEGGAGIGASGYSGYSGLHGASASSGYSGISGYSGELGYSGISGYLGISGYSGISSYSGYSGISGPSHAQNTDLYLATQVSGSVYVDKNRIDTYVENGTITKPFKTITSALNSIIDASESKRVGVELVGGGNYDEQVTLKAWVYIHSTRVAIIRCTTGHAVIAPANMPSTAVLDNIIVICDSVNPIHCGLYLQEDSNVALKNVSIIGISGDGIFQEVHGGICLMESSSATGYDWALRMTNGTFIANNSTFIGYGYDVSITSPAIFKHSYCQFLTGGPTGTGTITRNANSLYMGFVPAVSGNWSAVPNNVKAALDTMAGDKKMFVSTLQTGTGVEQSITHGLGVVPTRVIIGKYNTGAYTVAEGTHTSTVLKITATTGCTYKVMAQP